MMSTQNRSGGGGDGECRNYHAIMHKILYSSCLIINELKVSGEQGLFKVDKG